MIFSLCLSFSQIAKVEKLKPLELELRRLEDLSESIVNDFAYMKKREEEMRDTNGTYSNSGSSSVVKFLSLMHMVRDNVAMMLT